MEGHACEVQLLPIDLFRLAKYVLVITATSLIDNAVLDCMV